MSRLPAQTPPQDLSAGMNMLPSLWQADKRSRRAGRGGGTIAAQPSAIPLVERGPSLHR